MEKIKLFDLIEKGFLALRKTNKKIWIIGIIISIFSGGLILEDSLDYDKYSDSIYQNEYYDEEILQDDFKDTFSDTFIIGSLGYIITLGIVVILIFIAIMFIIGALICIITYYLYHSIYEAVFDTKLDRAPLGLVVKVNLIAILKTLGGLILFIVPGIIIGLKYAPVNYILCKHPELSSKEILSKTRELSKGFKWKMFTYNAFIAIVSVVIMSLCSPSMFVQGYIWIDILDMLIAFALTTFMVVYSGLFDMYLYKGMENSKYKLYEK